MPEDCPFVLQPVYSVTSTNQNLLLHEGKLQFRQGSQMGEGSGSVSLSWFPYPSIRFEIPSAGPGCPMGVGSGTLTLPAFGISVDAQVLQFTHTLDQGAQGLSLGGLPLTAITIQSGSPLAYVVFHVVNFLDFLNPRGDNPPPDYDVRRVVFEWGGWRVTLQGVDQIKSIMESLRLQSGYAITHVGKVERSDGVAFEVDTVKPLFEALYSCLSFCKGSWSPSLLPVGFDLNGNRAWQEWCVRKPSAWKGYRSWFPDHSPECLKEVFPGFMALWQDEDWNDVIKIAIHWFVEANMVSGAIEGSVIMCQTAFELLSWFVLVEEHRILSSDGFKGLPAMDKLRLLFSRLEVPLDLGRHAGVLSALDQLARAENWSDAPEGLTQLRNAIVHPDRKNRQRLARFPFGARQEAWSLGLWYLELLLLRLCDYRGSYCNRLTARFLGEQENVPWAH